MSAKKADHTVTDLCRVLEISTSGYYAWLKRLPSEHQQEDERLLAPIKPIFDASRQTYGSPRVHANLKELGHKVAKKRVARIMQENGLVVLPSRGWRCVTTKAGPNHGVAPNELDRDFEASRINEKWVTDVTCVLTEEGWLYLASMIDLYNRGVVGWAMSENNDTQLTLNALDMALEFIILQRGLSSIPIVVATTQPMTIVVR
ncbi:IS3 family transposase [bacterium]|nr:IS3 family transposase [bacterium]